MQWVSSSSTREKQEKTGRKWENWPWKQTPNGSNKDEGKVTDFGQKTDFIYTIKIVTF